MHVEILKIIKKGLYSALLFTTIATSAQVTATVLDITSSQFGTFEQQPVQLFTLSNNNGMTIKVTNYGATVTSILMPDAKGNVSNIVAGFDTFSGYFSEEYIKNSPFFGGIIGRYTSFIKNSEFTLDGKVYKLANNANPHHIHGGKKGFDKRLWQVVKQQKNEKMVSLTLSLMSPDGEEAYPGNVEVSVEYVLTNNNELKINYQGKTDKRTPLSLTNHTYFNLSGFKDDALGHNVQLLSKAYLTPDDVGMHDGKLTQVHGATDFNQLKPLRSAFKELPQGFEHFYVFDNKDQSLDKIAYIEEPKSGRSMEVFTTEPSTLFYTGRYTSDKLQREDGTRFGKFRAFCIETSKYPNGPNIPNSPRTILNPGELYAETTVYKFSW